MVNSVGEYDKPKFLDMEKMTQKELRRLIRNGAAENITQCGQIHEPITQIGYSSGLYGCNGGLLRGDKTGKLYAIIGRTSAMFYYL